MEKKNLNFPDTLRYFIDKYKIEYDWKEEVNSYNISVGWLNRAMDLLNPSALSEYLPKWMFNKIEDKEFCGILNILMNDLKNMFEDLKKEERINELIYVRNDGLPF